MIILSTSGHIHTEEPVPSVEKDNILGATENEKPTPGEPDCTFRLDTPCKSNLPIDATSNCMVVTETTQMVKFVKQFSICQETNCQGKLKVNSIELAGLGGAASLSFSCTNCGSCNVKFETSSQREIGDAAVSKILQVATTCSGGSCAIYKKMFHHILGMHTVNDCFFGTLKEMYEHVNDILDGICVEARKEMQHMD
uniref:Uncharacterized protein n=1 Tax=Amphimedon queenslandica TaxID=400682 RepID=A0A1X7TW06_AMPQE